MKKKLANLLRKLADKLSPENKTVYLVNLQDLYKVESPIKSSYSGSFEEDSKHFWLEQSTRPVFDLKNAVRIDFPGV